jgi:hypothetical protein
MAYRPKAGSDAWNSYETPDGQFKADETQMTMLMLQT